MRLLSATNMLNITAGAVLITANLLVFIHATKLSIYDRDDFDLWRGYVVWDIKEVQRCFSIADCFNDRASSANWIHAPSDASVVFYDEEYCTGKQYVATDTPSGKVKFADVGLDNMISSFMVWEFGVFPTNGIVKICHKEDVLLAENSTSDVAGRR